MSEFKRVMREKTRMCEQIGICNKCPLSIRNNKTNMFCDTFMMKHPEEADSIIMGWSAEHPGMTNCKKFEEVFGFNIASMFEVNCRNAEWLGDEYKKNADE